MLKEESTALHFPNFKNGDGFQKLVVNMPDHLDLGERELHTLKDMKWNDIHQWPIKYWSRDIINHMRWLMRPPAYAKHLIYAPQHCFNSDTPLKRLYTEMHTAVRGWETQVRRDPLSWWHANPRLVNTQSGEYTGFMSDGTHLSNCACDKKEWPI